MGHADETKMNPFSVFFSYGGGVYGLPESWISLAGQKVQPKIEPLTGDELGQACASSNHRRAGQRLSTRQAGPSTMNGTN